MVTLDEITAVVTDQRKILVEETRGVEREFLASIPYIQSHALVMSGIRRCGKSTLLRQYVRDQGETFFYLSFEDLRIADFQNQHFLLLDEVIKKSKAKLLFFDEIQDAPHWELFVRQKLDQGFRLVITGSNASLLSRELGTRLTGRHISKELYPFSFAEYCLFAGKKPGKKTLDEYLVRGGFPEYLKTNSPDVLRALQNDILYRDIAVRYNVRDVSSLLTLYTYLVTNAAQLVSPNKLVKVVNAKSGTTVREYIGYFENSYLMQQISRFDWSAKKQSLAPKKIYIVDNGIIANTSLSFTRNTGALLENLVFMALRRLTADIFYYGDAEGECDFVVNPHGEKKVCLQACVELTLDNREREVAGLCRALDFFGLKEGLIVTRYQQDLILEGDKRIEVLPAWKAMSVLKEVL